MNIKILTLQNDIMFIPDAKQSKTINEIMRQTLKLLPKLNTVEDDAEAPANPKRRKTGIKGN